MVRIGKPAMLPLRMRIAPAHTSSPKPSAARIAIIVTIRTTVSRRFAASMARKSLAAAIALQPWRSEKLVLRPRGAHRKVNLRNRLILGRALEVLSGMKAEIRRDQVGR